MTKLRKGCRELVTMLMLLLLFLCSLLCLVMTLRPERTKAVSPQGLDLLLLIDHSNSMEQPGGGGSDPERLRLEAAELLITYLGLESQTAPHRLGLIYFGGQSQLVQPLTPLADPSQQEAVRQVLRHVELLDWTDPHAALKEAYTELYESERAQPEQRKAVILLTDGQPALPMLSTMEAKAAYAGTLRQLTAQFGAQRCPIFTIAISRSAIEANPNMQTFYRNLWQEIAATTPPAAYYELHSSQELPRVYHDIVVQLLGAPPGQPITTLEVDGATTTTVTMEEGLSRVILAFFKHDPGIIVTLQRPEGIPADPSDPDIQVRGGDGRTHDEIWEITNPREGVWTVALSGHGKVWVWKDTLTAAPLIPPQYTLAFPSIPTHIPAGQRLEVYCQVRDAEGEPPQKSEAVQVRVELRRAGFPEAILDVRAVDGGRYQAIHATGLSPGVYTLHGQAYRDGEEIAHGEVGFEAIAPSPETSPAEETPKPSWHYRVARVGGIGAAVLGLLGLVSILWHRKRNLLPPAGSQWQVLNAPAGQTSGQRIPLQGGARPSASARGGPLTIGGKTLAQLRWGKDNNGDPEIWILPSGELTLKGRDEERPLRAPHTLQDGDTISAGGYRLRYENLHQAAQNKAGVTVIKDRTTSRMHGEKR